MIRVYIAGPYTMGDRKRNILHAINVAQEVWKLGCAPFIPHLGFAWEYVYPRSWEEAMAYDDVWLQQCQVLVRIPGKSRGADVEVSRARHLGIPVFLGIEEFVKWRTGKT